MASTNETPQPSRGKEELDPAEPLRERQGQSGDASAVMRVDGPSVLATGSTDQTRGRILYAAAVSSTVTLILTLLVLALLGTKQDPSSRKSPYLAKASRLGEVIAAIQALGAYAYHDAPISYWMRADRLDSARTAWITVFSEHPEFFRLDDSKGEKRVALHWRWAQAQTYDPVRGEMLTWEQRQALPDTVRESLVRKPLEPDQIATLITTAIELHSRAVAHQQEQRWLVPLLFGLAGTLLGVVTTIAVALLKQSRSASA